MKKNRRKLSFRRRFEKWWDEYITFANISDFIICAICLIGLALIAFIFPALLH